MPTPNKSFLEQLMTVPYVFIHVVFLLQQFKFCLVFGRSHTLTICFCHTWNSYDRILMSTSYFATLLWTNLSAHLNRDAILNIGFIVAQRYIGLFRLRRVKVWLLGACPTVQRLRIELYHDCQQNCKVIVESMASMTLLETFCHIRTLAEHLHPDALVSFISLGNYLISHLALQHVRMAHRHPSVTTLCFFGLFGSTYLGLSGMLRRLSHWRRWWESECSDPGPWAVPRWGTM